ncbi:MAG: hypothetical protein EXS00_00360 [Phycisphaerales bacterium]|nr:hypothetical protein [Phycisphaerales bacterium]
MRRALRLARSAAASGEVPVGAVVYKDGVVLGEAANDREASADPTGHAEVVAIRRAGERLGSWRLDGCTIAVTLEPCAMCAGALVNSRMARVVYGADDPKAGACRSLFAIPEDRRLNHRLKVVRHVLRVECAATLRSFFRRRRAERSALGTQGDRVIVGTQRRSVATLTSPPRIVCFDLGGVLVRICRDWSQGMAAAGLKPKRFASGASADAARLTLLEQYQRGALTVSDFCSSFAVTLGSNWSGADVLCVHRAWIMGEYPGVDRLVDDLQRSGVRTACLSNTNDEHWRYMERSLPTVAGLHLRLASHQLRLHKPDRGIYEAFESISGCQSGEILFFDDLEANVAAARSLGWDAHRVDPQSDTAAFMRAHAVRRRALAEVRHG